MGFLRKTIIVGTGGLAPIKAQSYKERTAKAGEKQLQLATQEATLASNVNVKCPRCRAALVSPVGNNIKCPQCGFRMRVWRTDPSRPSANAPTADTASELERLTELHRSGALTEEEFAAAKAKTLRPSGEDSPGTPTSTVLEQVRAALARGTITPDEAAWLSTALTRADSNPSMTLSQLAGPPPTRRLCKATMTEMTRLLVGP